MEINPVVKCITVYPVKSLDGISLQQARIGTGGSLVHDREYAIIDSRGKYVNGKSNALVHGLRSKVDFDAEVISFRHNDENIWNRFHLQKDKEGIDEYLSAFFKIPVTLLKNTEGRFLDVPVKSGMTLLSTASLETVGSWFTGISTEDSRIRFRANIEVTKVPAFWEDRLFDLENKVIEFKIGEVILYGMGPRARCVVPTRHPQTGVPVHGFQKSFAIHRTASKPGWSLLDEYTHSYYLSVDCYVPPESKGKLIQVADELKITGKKLFDLPV